jgi:small conductance mechanosensitive channel
MNAEQFRVFLSTTATDLAIKVLAALAFWIIGRWIIGRVVAVLQKVMSRNAIDPTLTKYVGSIVGVALNIALVLGILGYFGIQTTSFAALLAGAGVAIGAAWSGLLAHFAAGAFLLVLRPFKVGDFISAGGIVGTVQEIGLFATTFLTPDNVKATVGNNKIFSDTIHNYSAMQTRRVERTAQLANGVDPFNAMQQLREAIAKIPNVALQPAPEVSLLDFQPQGPVIAVRPYTHTDHYWQVYFDTNEAIARLATANGWPVPALTQIHRTIAS